MKVFTPRPNAANPRVSTLMPASRLNRYRVQRLRVAAFYAVDPPYAEKQTEKREAYRRIPVVISYTSSSVLQRRRGFAGLQVPENPRLLCLLARSPRAGPRQFAKLEPRKGSNSLTPASHCWIEERQLANHSTSPPSRRGRAVVAQAGACCRGPESKTCLDVVELVDAAFVG